MATGKLVIVERYDVVAVSVFPPTAGVDNLKDEEPKHVFISPAEDGGGRAINVDLGRPVLADSFFLGFTNATTGQLRNYKLDDMGGSGAVQLTGPATIRAGDCATPRSSILLRTDELVLSRYFSFYVTGNVDPLSVGIVAVGVSIEQEWDREWGSGRRPIDTGRTTALLGGGFATQEGVRKGSYSWTFGDLTEAELERLWGVFLRNGTTRPVIVNEVDGAAVGANEKLHYGLFQRLDPWERREPNATKWSMEVEEWV